MEDLKLICNNEQIISNVGNEERQEENEELTEISGLLFGTALYFDEEGSESRWDRFVELPKLLLFEGMMDASWSDNAYTSPIQ